MTGTAGTAGSDTDTGPSGAGDTGCACRGEPREQGRVALLLPMIALLIRRRRRSPAVHAR